MMMVRLLAALAVMAVAACASNADERDPKVAAMAEAVVEAAAKSANGGTQEYTPKPGEGVLCMAALMSVAVEVGKHCLPEYNPEGQDRLRTNLKKLEDYMLAAEGATEENVDAFFKRQGARGDDPEKLCEAAQRDNTVEGLVKNFIDHEAAKLNAAIDKLTARRGQPAWGDCL